MKMQAVIVTGGKQYSVKEGDVLYIEKLNAEAETTVTFDQVLAVVDGENSKFGAPVVKGASVEAKVLKNGKGKKVTVFKYRWQPYTGASGGFSHYSGRKDPHDPALGEEDDTSHREGDPRCKHRPHSFKQR